MNRHSPLASSLINLRAFSVYSAIVAIYAVDADDAPQGDPVKLRVDAMPCTPQIDTAPVRRHGSPLAGTRHTGSAWAIELQRPALIELTGSGRAKVTWEPQFNARYAVVAVWHDVERGLWKKEVFTGVTGFPAALDAANTGTTISLRAERRLPAVASATGTPDFSVTSTGEVRYLAADGSAVPLYTFSAVDGFTAIDSALLATRATITADTTSVEIQFGSDAPVFTATESGIEIGEINESGATYGDTLPRIELRMADKRLASLGADGVLHVPAFTEGSEPTALAGAMVVRDMDGDWLFTLQAGGLWCAEVSEV